MCPHREPSLNESADGSGHEDRDNQDQRAEQQAGQRYRNVANRELVIHELPDTPQRARLQQEEGGAGILD